jgi:hypothetical protein
MIWGHPNLFKTSYWLATCNLLGPWKNNMDIETKIQIWLTFLWCKSFIVASPLVSGKSKFSRVAEETICDLAPVYTLQSLLQPPLGSLKMKLTKITVLPGNVCYLRPASLSKLALLPVYSPYPSTTMTSYSFFKNPHGADILQSLVWPRWPSEIIKSLLLYWFYYYR